MIITIKCLSLHRRSVEKYSTMQQKKYLVYGLLMMMLVGLLASQRAMAQQAVDTLDISQLRKAMYYHYSKHNTEEFLTTIDQLKRLAQRQGNEKEYYKACGNQIIYISANLNRSQAIELANQLFRQAEHKGSQYGLYTAHYAMGTICAALAQLDDAISHYEDALKILKEHYPTENRSALYLATAKVERAKSNFERVKELADLVVNDPKASLTHKLSAMSYRCLVLIDTHAPIEECDRAYAEREKIKAEYGHDDVFGNAIDFNQALLHNDFEWAQRVVDAMPEESKLSKLNNYARLYAAQGNYRKAYEYFRRYKAVSDSINIDNVRKTSLDVTMMMEKVHAENEARDLRLENQELEMARIASELQQKRMEEQALTLSMEYQQTRLHEMQAQRENDSLMADNKELQLSEYRSQMEAFENAERTRRMKWIAFWVLSIMGFAFVGFYANSRRLQLRRLKDAYDKLEETTAAKERIESELRIAREIQMAMVPHEFPKSPRLDIYASMMPAKEVGGDLYDFVPYDDQLYFCVGDVSGKGVPAALFMAMSARLFRTLSKYRLSPAQIANAMNNELVQNNDNGMFVTMFIGLLNLNTGHLVYCNCGHNPPVLAGEFIEMEANAPLGLWEGLDFVEQTIDSIRGQQFFVYSDGLTEAENLGKDQFGDDRLLTFLNEHQQLDARTLVEQLQQNVELHVNGAAPSDDLTMLCLRKK